MAGEAPHLLATFDIPQPQRVVGSTRAGENMATVGMEGHAPDIVRGPELREVLARVHVPQPHTSVLTPGESLAAVPGKGHARAQPGVSDEPALLRPPLQVPHAQRPLRVAGQS